MLKHDQRGKSTPKKKSNEKDNEKEFKKQLKVAKYVF